MKVTKEDVDRVMGKKYPIKGSAETGGILTIKCPACGESVGRSQKKGYMMCGNPKCPRCGEPYREAALREANDLIDRVAKMEKDPSLPMNSGQGPEGGLIVERRGCCGTPRYYWQNPLRHVCRK